MSWIKSAIILRCENFKLEPINESHVEELEIAASESRTFEFIPIDMSTKAIRLHVFEQAIKEKENTSQLPFVIIDNKNNRIVGSTRLMNIDEENKKIEIGWTWIHPDYWTTKANSKCKLLLLQHCFETLKAVRVFLKADEENIRSRKAIEKLGATFEGILRQDMKRANGTYRNSAFYSILNSEWQGVKERLVEHINNPRVGKRITLPIEFDNFLIRYMDSSDAESWLAFIEKNKTHIASTSSAVINTLTNLEGVQQLIRNRREGMMRKEMFSFTLFTKDTKLPIANLAIMNIDWSVPKGEIGYYIDKDYQGKGITTAFVKQMCDYAFEQLGFHKLFMRIRPDNVASKRIAEKNNFIPEGLLHQDYRNGLGELADVTYYAKLKNISE